MKKVSAVIVAAGEGRRFGAAKQFELLWADPEGTAGGLLQIGILG